MTNNVLAERNGGLLRVTLNRPEKANALNRAMREALTGHFRAAAEDPGLRALVITGAGEKAFCAGADLKEPGGLEDDSWDEMSAALSALPQFAVAMINGPCIGGGLSLALGCDMRLAVPRAIFSYPVLRNGLLPGSIDAERLRALLGPGRASSLLLAGITLSAEEALTWGLVERLVAAEAMEEAIGAVCAAALGAERHHLQTLKQICRGA